MTTRNTHTPGPWELHRVDTSSGDEIHDVADNAHIATVWKSNRAEDNAKLIAAAPELLEALEECLQWAKNQGWHQPGVDSCKAAIAKAKGPA